MNKTLILCLIIFSALAAKAQPSKDYADFNKWTYTQDSSRYQASQRKDYSKCIGLINEWLTKYSQISPLVQKNFATWNAVMYYNLACYDALTGQKQPALDAFRKAAEVGYKDYASTLTDSDLNSVRDEPDFKATLQKMREKGDYPYVLKNSGPYNGGNT